MSAYRSFTYNFGTANPLSLAKPSGLAVGDLMVFFVMSEASDPSGTPSGFTLIDSSGTTAKRIKTYTKTADAADVAASAFTVGNSAALNLAGVLYAVSTPGAVEYVASAYVPTTSNYVSVAGFTPAVTGDLLLVCTEAGSGPVTFSATNGNPTWIGDQSANSYWYYQSAHATYATGATGAITSTKATTEQAFAVVAIAPPSSGPTLATTAITAITTTTASSGGTLENASGLDIIDRGVCWNTGGAPTIADSHTND